MLPHALDATANGATELYIHTPDKDVLVLPQRRYPDLCLKISFVAGMGDNHRMIGLGSIVSALGSVERPELTGFHAFGGTDITGRFSGKGKLSCWKTFMDAEGTKTALETLEPQCIPQARYWPLWRNLYTRFITLERVSHKELRWHCYSVSLYLL